ncbi:MAG: 2-oxoglutarate dehydrogenase E1 component, partial [Alphaproteobacteria bacterium]|nr:2-oxoglutarate dehydrogenase E1 component [Alphaproteobacteria bacterium]
MGSNIEQTSFLNGANATFVAEIYAKYLENPDSVDPSWRDFFATLHDDVGELLEEMRGASWAPRNTAVVGHGSNGGNGHATTPATAAQGAPLAGAPLAYGAAADPQAAPDQIRQATVDSVRALSLIRSYRVRGHLAASLDPLGLAKPKPHPELDPATYGFTDA